MTLLVAGILFWLPVIQHPHAPKRPWVFTALYLFQATLPCDALLPFLALCGRIVYPSYASGPGSLDNLALRNQECAGAVMWVWITFAYLVPLSSSQSRDCQREHCYQFESLANETR